MTPFWILIVAGCNGLIVTDTDPFYGPPDPTGSCPPSESEVSNPTIQVDSFELDGLDLSMTGEAACLHSDGLTQRLILSNGPQLATVKVSADAAGSYRLEEGAASLEVWLDDQIWSADSFSAGELRLGTGYSELSARGELGDSLLNLGLIWSLDR